MHVWGWGASRPPGRLPGCPRLSLWLRRPFPTPLLDPTLRLPPYLPRAATGLCWQERAVSFLVPRWGPGHGRAGLAMGSVCPGQGARGPSLLCSQGPCVFCDYHWSLIRAPSPEHHLLNVTPRSQIGVVSMGKWKLTPLYPLKSVPEGTS